MCENKKNKKNENKKNCEKLDTVETGNTKKSVSTKGVKIRGRAFQFTLNNIETYDKIKEKLTMYSTLKYFISCKETAPTTGHEHIHIYTQFSQPKTIDTRDYHGAHIENCHGTPQENRAYIMKDGNILDELGTFKQQGGCSGLSIKQIQEMSEEEIFNIIDFKYYNVVKKIKNDMKRLNVHTQYKEDFKALYFYGKSESGKSYSAKKVMCKISETLGLNGDFDEASYKNNFWIGTHDNVEICLYDDFRDSDMKPNEFIKFIDYNKHVMNIKGGEMINNYNIVIITSIIAPWDLYRNKTEEDKKQWIRRLNIYEIENIDGKSKIKRITREEAEQYL